MLGLYGRHRHSDQTPRSTGSVAASGDKGVTKPGRERVPEPADQSLMTNRALLLRGGRVCLPGGGVEALDLAIGHDGRITDVGSALAVGAETEAHLGGRLIAPGLVDIHQHLDKSRTVRQVENPSGTLGGAVEAFTRWASGSSRQEIMERASRTVELCIERGTVAIRSHVNVDLESELRGVEALVELRERLRQRVRLEIVAFAASSAARAGVDASRPLLEAALDAGADVVGGVPALAPDANRFIGMLFEVAERRGQRLDLHVDETLDPTRRDVEEVIRRTRAAGLAGRVVASHCSSLGAVPLAGVRKIIDELAAVGIGVVTLPASNLYLQGRGADRLAPRGLTRVGDLLDAGVQVACGSDNIQDPFVPTGGGDLLEIARWTMLAAQLPARRLDTVVRMVTTVPATLMGFDGDYGIRRGAWADLLIAQAEDTEDLVMTGPLERTVLFRGRHVAGPRLPAISSGR